MPATPDTPADDARGAVSDIGRDVSRLSGQVREAAPELVRQARELFDERVVQIRGQGKEAAAVAGDQLEDARAYMVDRVQERPLTATFAALGVGFLLGLLLSGSRR